MRYAILLYRESEKPIWFITGVGPTLATSKEPFPAKLMSFGDAAYARKKCLKVYGYKAAFLVKMGDFVEVL